MSTMKKTSNLNLSIWEDISQPDLYKTLSDNFTVLDAAVSQNGVEASQLDTRVENLEDDVMSLGTWLTTTADHVSVLTTQMARAEQDIASLQPQSIHNLEARMENAENHINSNANLIQALDVRLADDEDNMRQHEIRIANLENALSAIHLALQSLQTGVAEMSTELTEAKAEIVTAQNDIADLDGKFDTLDANVTAVNTSIDTVTTNLETVTGNVENLQGRMTTTEAKVIGLDQRVTVLENK